MKTKALIKTKKTKKISIKEMFNNQIKTLIMNQMTFKTIKLIMEKINSKKMMMEKRMMKMVKNMMKKMMKVKMRMRKMRKKMRKSLNMNKRRKVL